MKNTIKLRGLASLSILTQKKEQEPQTFVESETATEIGETSSLIPQS